MAILKQVREHCIETVEKESGITGHKLMLNLMGTFLNVDTDLLRKVPAQLSQEGLIVEIEYIIPGEKSQSFFMPKGTVINIPTNKP